MNRKAIKKKYVRTSSIGDEWSTYLRVGVQSFNIVTYTTEKRAKWYARQLAKALEKLISENQNK